MLQLTEGVARCAQRWTLWLLELDGLVVGSGGLESFEDSAVLIAGCEPRGTRSQTTPMGPAP